MTLPDRFWRKVDQSGDCWIWTSQIDNGYGRFRWKGRPVYAHRLAYEELVGPIPDGLTIDHLCRQRLCVNPAHLEVVTIQENIRRNPKWAGNRTHCPKGHEYAGDNLLVSGGKRYCRTCNREKHRAV